MTDRILVVDDDESMRASLELELKSAGYDVVTASTGREAIEKAQAGAFDLFVTDVRLPGMTGLSAIAVMRDLQPGARSIIITGYASADAPLTALKLKVDDYLMKPFSSEELLRSVRVALEQRRLAAGRDMRSLRGRNALLRLLVDVFSEGGTPDRLARARRVARYSTRLAYALGLSPQRTAGLHLAALLRDIGGAELHSGDPSEARASQPLIARDILLPLDEIEGRCDLHFASSRTMGRRRISSSAAGNSDPSREPYPGCSRGLRHHAGRRRRSGRFVVREVETGGRYHA